MDQPSILRLHSKSSDTSLPIVLLGDAIHPMSPFKGQGANQALTDGPALTDWLLKSNLPSALLGFEREMHSRTRPKVLASREAALFLHSKDVMNIATSEQTIAGVRKECVNSVVRKLRERNITAYHSEHLDDKVKGVIKELGAGVDFTSPLFHEKKNRFSESELDTVKQLALSYAAAGDTFNLRNISIQYSCAVIQTAVEESTGRTCLYLAAEGGHFNTTKWLLMEVGILGMIDKEGEIISGDGIMITNIGQNPLHAAVIGGNAQVLSSIVKKCSRPLYSAWNEIPDDSGVTPLDLVDRTFLDENKKDVLRKALRK